MNNNSPQVSLIIPVYNVKETIHRCIETAINQRFSDYEIILVDDGSTDGSGSICDDYASERDNIHVIHKANGGLGSARNAGIQSAKGHYVCFADSDDYLEIDYISKMYYSLVENDVDLVISGYSLIRKGKEVDYSPRKLTGVYRDNEFKAILLEYAKGSSFLYFAWNKLFKRDLIIHNNLKYFDRHCAEDMMFNAGYYGVSKSVIVIPDCLYKYTIDNSFSLSNRRRLGYWEDMKLVIKEYQKIYDNDSDLEKKQPVINNLVVVLLRNAFSNYISNEKYSLKESVSYIKKCSEDKDIDLPSLEIIPNSKIDNVILFSLRHRWYVLISLFTRFKAFLKWKLFNVFNIFRKMI